MNPSIVRVADEHRNGQVLRYFGDPDASLFRVSASVSPASYSSYLGSFSGLGGSISPPFLRYPCRLPLGCGRFCRGGVGSHFYRSRLLRLHSRGRVMIVVRVQEKVPIDRIDFTVCHQWACALAYSIRTIQAISTSSGIMRIEVENQEYAFRGTYKRRGDGDQRRVRCGTAPPQIKRKERPMFLAEPGTASLQAYRKQPTQYTTHKTYAKAGNREKMRPRKKHPIAVSGI